jgi:hypothetical protein
MPVVISISEARTNIFGSLLQIFQKMYSAIVTGAARYDSKKAFAFGDPPGGKRAT